jgi:hypothetical protein
MDPETLKFLQAKIVEAEQKIREAEKDIADARRAGLEEVAKTQEKRLNEIKARLAKLRSVYGPRP